MEKFISMPKLKVLIINYLRLWHVVGYILSKSQTNNLKQQTQTNKNLKK